MVVQYSIAPMDGEGKLARPSFFHRGKATTGDHSTMMQSAVVL